MTTVSGYKDEMKCSFVFINSSLRCNPLDQKFLQPVEVFSTESARRRSPRLFVKRLIKARSTLGGFTASGSFRADAHEHPLPLEEEVHAYIPVCSCSAKKARQLFGARPQSAKNLGFCARVLKFGGRRRMLIRFWNVLTALMVYSFHL